VPKKNLLLVVGAGSSVEFGILSLAAVRGTINIAIQTAIPLLGLSLRVPADPAQVGTRGWSLPGRTKGTPANSNASMGTRPLRKPPMPLPASRGFFLYRAALRDFEERLVMATRPRKLSSASGPIQDTLAKTPISLDLIEEFQKASRTRPAKAGTRALAAGKVKPETFNVIIEFNRSYPGGIDRGSTDAPRCLSQSY
jgi:hypothetical protein